MGHLGVPNPSSCPKVGSCLTHSWQMVCATYFKAATWGVSKFEIFSYLQLADLIWTSFSVIQVHFPLSFSPWGSKQIYSILFKCYFLLSVFSFLDWTMPFPSSFFLWLIFCRFLVSPILSSQFFNPFPSEITTARVDVVFLLRPYHHQEK